MYKAIETVLIHGGHEINTTRAVTMPIWATSTYKVPDSFEESALIASQVNPTGFYGRYGNPTNKQIEIILTQLEGTESSVLTSSGMGAISAAIFALVKSGDHIVAQNSHYATTNHLMKHVLPLFNISVTYVDQLSNEDFKNAIQENTKLIYIETPSNPLMKITDIKYITALAKERNLLTLCDNTFATPINQQPHMLGVDVVVHSATKYLGGHSDLLAGAVCSSSELIEKIWHMMIVLGSSLSSFDSWLLLRGLKTLSLRMNSINQNALKLANFLSVHPRVNVVHYCGLESSPQYALARKQMSGFSGMLSFELKGNSETEKFNKAQQLIRNLTLFQNAISLGGVESLIAHLASLWNKLYTKEERIEAGITDGLLRISVGIENADDLIEDFRSALSTCYQ